MKRKPRNFGGGLAPPMPAPRDELEDARPYFDPVKDFPFQEVKTISVELPEYGPLELDSSELDNDNLTIKMSRKPTGRWIWAEIPVEAYEAALLRNNTDRIAVAYVKEMQRALGVLSSEPWKMK